MSKDPIFTPLDRAIDQLRTQDVGALIGELTATVLTPVPDSGEPVLHGVCPFCQHSSAQFTVFTDTQSYHCFDCFASGTIFDVVMQMKHLTFGETLQWLADRYQVELPKNS